MAANSNYWDAWNDICHRCDDYKSVCADCKRCDGCVKLHGHSERCKLCKTSGSTEEKVSS